MSSKITSRDSSALFLTPRSCSFNDVEISNTPQLRFQPGANTQMEAPEGQPQQQYQQQQYQQQEQWVSQQQWEQEQYMQQQQRQQEWQEQWQHEQALAYPPVEQQNIAALTETAVEQLQQNPVEPEDLSKMIGEGEYQKPPGKAPSWNYPRSLSSHIGFSSMGQGAQPQDVQPQKSESRMNNSGVSMEKVHHWNAVTNMPVQPLGQEARGIESRKFTFDTQTGEYVNALDETDRMSADRMQELRSALSRASVDETVVDLIKRRTMSRKMTRVSQLFLYVTKNELSAITGTQGMLPHVVMAHLPDRYIKTYDRTNCMGQIVSTRKHKLTGCI